ncbi:MAG: GTP-binding protein [bacterium]|nr:GTP-binding protein [bacterium]
MPTKTQQLIERPPIIVIMGHIDHGKSKLLDYIRKTNIVEGEAGGITQHISAYEVLHKDPKGAEKRITFLDTPGHEAFKGMRARGARVADIAVLVVSAEDGVKAQTVEAYKAIMEAKIPYIVAINKIDKPNANIERTKQTLAEAGIYVEGYGGDIPWVGISAKVGTGVNELLDMMLLVAELAELKGDPGKPAEGVIIESHMDPKKGVTATVVLTDGTLARGMFAVAEDVLSPVRMMENFIGKAIETATFGPIRLTGWSGIPPVGAIVSSYKNKKDAERVVGDAKTRPAKKQTAAAEEGVVTVPIILKTDVAGTLEAIEGELLKLTHERVRLKIVHKGVGAVSESDVKVAMGIVDPIVIGFHTKTDALAADLASRNNITIHAFDIIYKLTEWLAGEILHRAPHINVIENLGELRIIRCFSQQKEKQVVGGRVTVGKISSGAKFKIVRRDTEVGEGKIVEVQCQKIKTKEASEGSECGLEVESKITIAERDVLVPYIVVSKQ